MSQAGTGAQQVSLLAFTRGGFIGCRSFWQLCHGVADTGLVPQTATCPEKMSRCCMCQADVIGWYRHRIVPQAVAGTKQAFLSETGLGQMSQTDAVIGQVA